jgi:hypothetical protein
LFEIKDIKLLGEIKPLLQNNKVLEAVKVCAQYYGDKYAGMAFKDWFKLVNNLYKEISA